MSDENHLSRRELIGRVTKSLIVTAMATPVAGTFETVFALTAHVDPVNAVAGVDRVVMRQGKTWLNAWTGYGVLPRAGRPSRGAAATPSGPAPKTTWSRVSGPGTVTFADPNAAATTATFSTTGNYVLRVSADNGETTATSTLTVRVELPPPMKQLSPVVTTRHTITSPLWRARTKTLITSWIPHCIEQCTRPDIPAGRGDGGLDNFIEAAKALRGEPHAAHRGYVFSNAWVHQTVEAMSLALMVDPQGDADIGAVQAHMRSTFDAWIPQILAAQHPASSLRCPESASASAVVGDERPPSAIRTGWRREARIHSFGHANAPGSRPASSNPGSNPRCRSNGGGCAVP